MSTHDFLVRPEHPEASQHRPKPPQRYVLKKSGADWFMVPMIYEWGFEMFCKAWSEEALKTALGTWGIVSGTLTPGPKDVPKYAIHVPDLSKLTFIEPVIAAD